MIQRIQSVYLLLAALACLLCLCLQVGTFMLDGGAYMRMFNLWIVNADGSRNFIAAPLFVILVPTVALCVYTIFIYKNRKTQARFTNFAILLLAGWYVVYTALMLTTTAKDYNLEWPAFLPLFAIILCLMAHRGIIHDERLVRAANRIR